MNKGSVTARVREPQGDADAKDEFAVLKEWLKLKAEEDAHKKKLSTLEMVHLLEPTHSARFVSLMDRFLPT